MNTRYFRLTMLTLTVYAVMHSTWADDTPTVSLEGMTIELAKKPKTKTGETTITRRELNEANIQNSHDLVRYNTEVDVAEVGRYGNKGFAIRGVDGNRVAMSIDGVALPEVEVNEIFSPYGYMYEGRFNPDLEMMSKVNITAGADSLLSGSGAVGGSVAYSTKNPSDLVRGNKTLGGYAKVGYTNKNEELLSAVGLAGVYDRAEFLLNYSRREGHELKNHDMKKHDKSRMDINYTPSRDEMGRVGENRSSTVLDAVDYKKDSFLGKFYYHLTDEHRLGASILYQKQNTDSLAYSKSGSSGGNRFAQDVEKGKGYGVNYLYRPNHHHLLDSLGVTYQYQDILGLADTDVYVGGIRSRKEYRPTETQTHQTKIDMAFLPLDFGKFGEHNFKLSGLYNKQDYKSTNVAVKYKTTGELEQAIQPYNIVFPDAKKDNHTLILSDGIRFNDRLSTNLGIRYDHYRYTPYFQDDVYFDDIRSSEQNEIANNVGKSWIRTKFYQDYRNGVYNQQPNFKKFTYHGAFDYQMIPNRLAARYKVGTGFLAPTVTQMYSAFQGQGVKQIINPNLKPETSLNHELEFEYHPTNHTKITAGGYYSKYKDFIHTTYWQASQMLGYRGEDKYGCGNHEGTCTMSHNLDKADIKGLKFGIESDLSNKFNLNGRLGVSANFHTSWDSALIATDHNGKVKINTLASVPTSLIFGADYYSPDNDWSLHGRVRGIMRKKDKDTKFVDTQDIEEVVTRTRECPYMPYIYYCELDGYFNDGTGKYVKTDTRRTITGYKEFVNTYKHTDKSENVWLLDVYGSKKFGKNQNIILNAGVYNLTNEKYIPWESLRQFNNLSANTMVDEKGAGFNRYTAPGRNYAVSLTYEF